MTFAFALRFTTGRSAHTRAKTTTSKFDKVLNNGCLFLFIQNYLFQQVEDRQIGNPDDNSDEDENGGSSKTKDTKGAKADQTPYYLIHYDRWHRRFDEWVPESRLILPAADKVWLSIIWKDFLCSN
jgi:hypothetical protein